WMGDRDDLCVVGDPAQTIYSFTGATPRYLTEFSQRFPAAVRVQLVRNYRSSPQIIDVANAVLPLDTARLRSQQDSGPRPELTTYPDDEAEAHGVAQAIRDRVRQGAAPGSMAVLFRTNAQSQALEAALSQLDVPYLVRGGERFFSRTEVRGAIVLLRGQVRSDDPSTALADRVRDVLSSLGHGTQAPAGGATRDRWESLEALIQLAQSLEGDGPRVAMAEFVGELDRRISEQHAPSVDGVTLASLHAAKGLEWDHVFVIGCSEGLLPITLAEGPARIAEEQRLLYVALTRARHHLDLSWASSRSTGGRASRKLSRFLVPAAELLGVPEHGPSARLHRSAKPRKPRARAVCRTCGNDLSGAAERKIGRCASCPATYEESVFEALRQWRSETATAAKVPAFVVFTDATLTAIAEQTPKDAAGLLAISGVGSRKLDLYGQDVLRILTSA
ncbi:MAG: ATP-dependent DNA helicase UvrD2, partial [Ornithinimicrobium sp.]